MSRPLRECGRVRRRIPCKLFSLEVISFAWWLPSGMPAPEPDDYEKETWAESERHCHVTRYTFIFILAVRFRASVRGVRGAREAGICTAKLGYKMCCENVDTNSILATETCSAIAHAIPSWSLPRFPW